MTYVWNSRLMGDVFVLPGAVADEHLRLAGSAQLKILLWCARHAGRFDERECAKAIGISPADCADALQFWLQTGVLCPAEGDDRAPQKPPEPAPQKTVTLPVATARPAPVKPRLDEVIARQEQSADFAALVDTVSARLGKPLSHGDVATLLYLYDTAGLPAEVIVMITVWAVSGGKGNMRYIEKMALDWADRHIVTMEAAERELFRLEQRQSAVDRVRDMFSITAPPTFAQAEMAYRWLVEWGMADEMIRAAGDQCLKRCEKFSYAYVNKIVERWHAEGITTPQALEKTPAKGKKRPTSFDLDAYDEIALRYTPVYDKPEGKEH
ncbi:MAG: DnaD domain protein [Acutalibacteraceae bacterium]|jgi:DnaD/phage-associated family protein